MTNNLSIWFIRLRWFAFLAQIGILGISVAYFKVDVEWQKILLILFLIPFSNLLTTKVLINKFLASKITIYLLFLDIFILAGVLFLSGGPANPFTIVFLLHLVLTAVLLNERWTWIIAFTTCLLYAFLFFYSPESATDHHHHHATSSSSFSLHLYGMLFAFMTVAILVAYFLNKIIRELRSKELKLQKLEQFAVNSQRLSSLVTITAGVAHELGTPLSTIAVVSKELEIQLKKLPEEMSLEMKSDIKLIQQEVTRCKTYLTSLAEKTGDLTGESLSTRLASEIIQEVITPLQHQQHVFEITGANDHLLTKIPAKSLVIALRALVKNALDATKTESKKIQIKHQIKNSFHEIEISDQGEGMTEETLELIGEPFYSTKNSEEGLGLGVYLSKLVANQLGGELTFVSKISEGTSAKFKFPALPK